MNFKDLPKIELHLHLDCSLSFNVVQKLRPDITNKEYEKDFIAPVNCSSLEEYLKCAQASINIMQSPEQLELVTLDLFDQLKDDNVIYAEIRFAPLQHLKNGLSAHEVVEIVNSATQKGINKTGVKAGIILCTLRHFSEEQSMETVRLVEKFRGSQIVGFDIAADEMLPITNHIKAFNYARDQGIHCTAHAGEARGAESVREVLTHFHPSRIGHGVRSTEDDQLMQHIKEQNIHLEICPTSNVQTGIYTSVKDHHVDNIYQEEISMSINTDGRSISNVSLLDEYHKLHRYFQWDASHFLTCNQYAIDAAFTDNETKAYLHKRLIQGFEEHVDVAFS